jgi:hypothetical protein
MASGFGRGKAGTAPLKEIDHQILIAKLIEFIEIGLCVTAFYPQFRYVWIGVKVHPPRSDKFIMLVERHYLHLADILFHHSRAVFDLNRQVEQRDNDGNCTNELTVVTQELGESLMIHDFLLHQMERG